MIYYVVNVTEKDMEIKGKIFPAKSAIKVNLATIQSDPVFVKKLAAKELMLQPLNQRFNLGETDMEGIRKRGVIDPNIPAQEDVKKEEENQEPEPEPEPEPKIETLEHEPEVEAEEPEVEAEEPEVEVEEPEVEVEEQPTVQESKNKKSKKSKKKSS